MTKLAPKELLRSEVVAFMSESRLWDDTLKKEIPSSWENYCGFIIFSKPAFQSSKWKNAGPCLWEVVCLCLKAHSVAIKDTITNDSFRSPKAELVYGNSVFVKYRDNGIWYTWNVERNMFCAGNVTERHRIGSLDCHDEVIVDLFAGIGYFTIPFLVHAKAKFVYACEWNPDAVEALRKNLLLNKVEDKCDIYEGDNRKFHPKKVANRVNLGLIPSSEEYWRIGCEALLESGGILYIHNNVTSLLPSDQSCKVCKSLLATVDFEIAKNMTSPQVYLTKTMEYHLKYGSTSIKWKHPEWFIFSIHISHALLNCLKDLYDQLWSVSVENVFKVKSYAPHIYHLVFSVRCKPV